MRTADSLQRLRKKFTWNQRYQQNSKFFHATQSKLVKNISRHPIGATRPPLSPQSMHRRSHSFQQRCTEELQHYHQRFRQICSGSLTFNFRVFPHSCQPQKILVWLVTSKRRILRLISHSGRKTNGRRFNLQTRGTFSTSFRIILKRPQHQSFARHVRHLQKDMHSALLSLARISMDQQCYTFTPDAIEKFIRLQTIVQQQEIGREHAAVRLGFQKFQNQRCFSALYAIFYGQKITHAWRRKYSEQSGNGPSN